jgi:hypothetical protein
LAAKAELSEVLKKVAELGIEGAAKYQTVEYQGVLQKDLARALRSYTDCKIEVWRGLKDKLLPDVPAPEPPSLGPASPSGGSANASESGGPSTRSDPAADESGTLSLVQSKFGRHGNFELLVPRREGGVAHFWRDNDAPGNPWRGPGVFGEDLGRVDAVALIQSTFSEAGNGPGNFEVVVRVGGGLVGFWHPDNGRAWLPAGAPKFAVAGNPVLIQGRFGRHGNFELVVPRRGSGLAHFWRDNDAPGRPWKGPGLFGEEVGHVDAVALIQSTFSEAGNGPGNLEVVARVGDRLVAFWHPDNGRVWRPAGAPQVSASGNPVLIQSRFGRYGNFELVVPRREGGVAHFWRDNDAPGNPWRGPGVFGEDLGRVDAVALIQSTFSEAGNGPGNFEVVARVGDRLVAFWHPDNGRRWLPAGAPPFRR